jgi:opacity protein-like surface antigen
MLIKSLTRLLKRVYGAILLALIVFPLNALAADDDKWTFTVAPYLWVTGQEGKVATLPPAGPADLDISFSDVIDDMDMTLMGLVAARKGRIGIFGEVFHVDISSDIDTGDILYSGGDYNQDLWAISLGVSYAVLQNNESLLDMVVGVRFWDLDNELKLDAGILPDARSREQESWNETFVGLRARTGLGEAWFLTGWGMVAVAGDSDTSWDVYAGAGYEYSDSISLTLGYRHQEIEYENGDFLYDIRMSGPVTGLSFRF